MANMFLITDSEHQNNLSLSSSLFLNGPSLMLCSSLELLPHLHSDELQ